MQGQSMMHKSVIKASGAISIENKISLVQRQLWNILLSHAFDDLPQQTRHEVPLRLIFAEKGFDLKEYAELKKHLTALVETTVKWNIHEKDKRIWGVSTLLASAEINEETGMLEYSYSDHIREKLTVPKARYEIGATPYARLSLATQREFRSKHTQFLYEFLTDAFHERQKQTITGWIHINTYQEMTGTNYTRWSDINEKLIKAPIKELEPHVPFEIYCQSMKAMRKTTHIRFRLVRKDAKK